MEIKTKTLKISEILELKRKQIITVNPEYQRGAVWSDNQQRKLIDTVLRGYPLPVIYLHFREINVAGITSQHLEIIDGQQRINAFERFYDGAIKKLFDPIKDDKIARFPKYIREQECNWAGKDFLSLPNNLKNKFLDTELLISEIATEIEDEARDLFIRLQAGLPLNSQEKRDAWPGGFTEIILKFGGKSNNSKYPGHDFFKKLVSGASKDRGKKRQLCA